MEQDKTKAFFEKVLLTGSNYERAKTVVDFLKIEQTAKGLNLYVLLVLLLQLVVI
jgi:hypothetical protein